MMKTTHIRLRCDTSSQERRLSLMRTIDEAQNAAKLSLLKTTADYWFAEKILSQDDYHRVCANIAARLRETTRIVAKATGEITLAQARDILDRKENPRKMTDKPCKMYVFEKKAGETFHLDEWIAFLACLGECWNQPELPAVPGYRLSGIAGDECCVVRDFSITVEADWRRGGGE